jgi:hypothetical protein
MMDARRWKIRGLVCAVALTATVCAAQDAAPPAEAPTEPPTAPAEPAPVPEVIPGVQPFSFKGPDGRTYAGQIDHPPPDKRNGFAVVMLGGGYANDLDWMVPAEYAIDGAASRDGARLAGSLAARGFVVMRWETIPTEGDLRAQWPNVAIFASYDETLQHARAALGAFRQLALVEPARIVLLGHSLGATRACQLAESDGPVAGLVLLAGAQITRTGHDPAERQALADAWIGPIDPSADGLVSAEEYEAARTSDPARSLGAGGFADIDRDGDGQARRWEVAAQRIIAMRSVNDGSIDFDKDWRKYTQSRPEDVIAKLGLPVLAVYGGLDEDHAVHGPILEARGAAEGWKDLQVRYFAAAGHQLGPEQAGQDLPKFGPMADEVVNAVGEWLEARFHK